MSDVKTTTQAVAELGHWFQSPLGQALLETESLIIEQVLQTLFGYHLLQLSVVGDPLFRESPVGHKFRMGIGEDAEAPFLGDPADLPFANNSVDVVLLHHLLDVARAPQQILRESARVAIPAGHLIVTGFNPSSLWGLSRAFMKWYGRAPWNCSFIGLRRLMDWLTLLDFKIDRVVYGYYRLPTARWGQVSLPDFSEGLSRKMNWPLGTVYVLLARKQVVGMTPIRPKWRRKPVKIGQISVIKPTAKSPIRR